MAKSSSSAWPDLSASTVPQLSAHVHRLSPPQRAAVSAQTVHFRALRAEEMVPAPSKDVVFIYVWNHLHLSLITDVISIIQGEKYRYKWLGI